MMQEIALNPSYLEVDEESIRELRTNISFLANQKEVLCITSAHPNEGKSTISFMLAKSFAEKGKRVLLIDADLRLSEMKSRFFKGRIRYGLSHTLAGQMPFEDVICQTDVANLFVALCGPFPPNPAELLDSPAFATVLDYARANFDEVIIDAPPVGSVVDGVLISKQVDGVILVVAKGATSRRDVIQAKKQLEFSGSRILGTVLNKVDNKKKYGYYKYEYAYKKGNKKTGK